MRGHECLAHRCCHGIPSDPVAEMRYAVEDDRVMLDPLGDIVNDDAAAWLGHAYQFVNPLLTPREILVMALVVVVFAIFLFEVKWRVGKANIHAIIRNLSQRLQTIADDDLVEG